MEDVPMNLEERLSNHVFCPASWIDKAAGNNHIARYYQNKIAPMSQFKKADYLDHFTGRLVLLNTSEWQILGFSVALVPFAGSIANTLNGKLRRAVKTRLCEQKVAALDLLEYPDCQSLLAADAWSDVDKVSGAGICAILESLEWSPSQKAILDLRFERRAPATTHLTHSLVEALCKISLPTLCWLFPDQLSR